jgi:hypothetical protein
MSKGTIAQRCVFSITIDLCFGHPAIALHSAGYTKGFAMQDDKGLYATMGLLLIMSLTHESKATLMPSGICRTKV